MPSKRASTVLIAAFAVISGFVATTAPASAASKEKVLYNFCCANGAIPSGVIFDAAGNLFGTTESGGSLDCGSPGCGTVFELTRREDGKWREKVLYNFCTVQDCADGSVPSGGLIFDTAKNLYGTTIEGGTGACNLPSGGTCGTVFQLTPGGNGHWKEKVLHSFAFDGMDGIYPDGGLILDKAGNLYGTTSEGGTGPCEDDYHDVVGCGTVFQLTPTANGKWAEKVLYSFNDTDGDGPEGLIFDRLGNLYGITGSGGSRGVGAVFELSRGKDGKWREKVLYNFCIASNCADGDVPNGGLIFDAGGNLYGTTYFGGAYGDGTAFRLVPGKNGTWTEKTLHSFNGRDGRNPDAGLILDAEGNLYGMTWVGGASGGDCTLCGTVFKLTRNGGGTWTEKVLHSFTEGRADGILPFGGLIFDAAGHLYGTTAFGGALGGCDGNDIGCGIVFEIKP